MARLRRLDVPRFAQHIVQRGIDRGAIFRSDEDYLSYLRFLREGLHSCGCRLHAFVLMENHVHLLATGESEGAVSALMQSIGRRYACYFNASHSRTGTLFDGRFRASPVEPDHYLLACMFYIELNPVRAGCVDVPEGYRWSSYRHHAGIRRLDWLSDPIELLGLGTHPEACASAYVRRAREPLAAPLLKQIRDHLNKNCALGSSDFQQRIERLCGRRAAIAPQGRPRRRADAALAIPES